MRHAVQLDASKNVVLELPSKILRSLSPKNIETIGSAAAGAAYYNNGYNSCYYDSYGQHVCPNQYQY
jgi:hypothetical protein